MPLRRLLVPVDFSDASRDALRLALDLARRTGADAEVLHVAEVSDRVWEEDEDLRVRLRARLADLLAGETEGLRVEPRLEHGDRAAHVIAEAAALADLVVLGARGHRRLRQLLVGSTTERVARTAPCPVLAVPAGGRLGGGPVLAGTDLSDDSPAGVGAAKELAAALGVELVLVHVVEEIDVPGIYGPISNPLDEAFPELRIRLDEALAALARDAPGPEVPVRQAVERGRASDILHRISEELDVAALVLTARRDPVAHLLSGSTSEQVLRHLPVPVLLVRSPAST